MGEKNDVVFRAIISLASAPHILLPSNPAPAKGIRATHSVYIFTMSGSMSHWTSYTIKA